MLGPQVKGMHGALVTIVLHLSVYKKVQPGPKHQQSTLAICTTSTGYRKPTLYRLCLTACT